MGIIPAEKETHFTRGKDCPRDCNTCGFIENCPIYSYNCAIQQTPSNLSSDETREGIAKELYNFHRAQNNDEWEKFTDDSHTKTIFRNRAQFIINYLRGKR